MSSGPAHADAVAEQALIDAFERAWQTEKPPHIRDFLAQGHSEPAGAALPNHAPWELVILDLWHRWRRASGSVGAATSDSALAADDSHGGRDDLPPRPLLEDYLRAFPELGPLEQLPLDAIAEEYRARLRWSSGTNEASYLERFPARREALPPRLAAVRDEVVLATASYVGHIGKAIAGKDDAGKDGLAGDHAPGHASSPRTDRLAATQPFDNSKLLGARFRVLRPHAKGGLGQVSVARDEELQREVALKELQDRHADHPDLRARFLQEAEVTGRLEHPGIVPVYGLGHHADGRPYYAMRFIRGDSLQEAILRFHDAEEASFASGERAVELRKLLGRFIDVCYAVAYAHSRGVVHRDLKPGNIMLGPYGETLVVDWGFAKALDRHEPDPEVSQEPIRPAEASGFHPTQMGSAIGTPRFMSPEQAAGRLDLLGPATDVYSLGATLYSLLTGRPPIEGDHAAEVLRNVELGRIRPPREINPSIAPALEAICLKAMALEREQRYASPKELADDIEHWRADEPVVAYREPILARAARWGRRHKALMAGCFGLVTAAAVGLAISTVLVKQQQLLTEEARRLADQKSVEARQAQSLAMAEARHAQNEAERAKKSDREAQQALYYSNIALAQRFLQDGEVLEAGKTLDACPEDYRHWEWQFLRDIAARDRQSFRANVTATRIAFSPDGTQIAIGTDRGELLLRDDSAGQFLLRKPVHDGAVRGVVYRPDGKAVATAGADGLARIWSVPDGELLVELRGHGKSLRRALAFSRDGKLLATASDDLTVRVWDPNSGSGLHQLNCKSLPHDVAWQGDGPGLLVLEEKSRVSRWDTARDHHSDIPLCHGNWMCANAEGNLVATSFNGGVRVVRLGGEKPEIVFDKKGADYSLGLALDAHGKTVVAHGIGVGLQVFDVETGAQLYRVFAPPLALAMSPNGARVVHQRGLNFALFPTRLRWDSPEVRLSMAQGRPDEFRRALAAGSRGIYDLASGSRWISAAATLLPQGQLFLQKGEDGRLRACDLVTGFVQRMLPIPAAADAPYGVSPDGKLIAAVDDQGDVRIYDLGSDVQQAMLPGAGKDANRLVFAPHDTVLATAYRSGLIRVWNWRDGKSLGDFGVQHPDAPTTVCAFDPTGELLATSGGRADPKLHIWRWRDHQPLLDADGHPGGIEALAFSRDGRRLLSGGHDGAVRLWDPASGREVLKIDASQDSVAGCLFNADETAIVSAGAHHEAPRFWGGLSVPLPANHAVSLLPWLRRHESSANPAETSPAISITSSDVNVFSVPIAAPGSYRIQGKFTRTRSGHKKTVGIVLPAGAGRTLLVLDHLNRATSGLDQIDGRGVGDANDRENPTNCPVTLVDGKTYSLEAEVRLQADEAAVTVRLDERQIIRWQGPQRALNVYRTWVAENPRMLGLALADADVKLEQLDFTPLDAQSRLLESSPRPLPLPPGATRVPPLESVDLLPLLNLEHGVFDAAAKRSGQGIELSVGEDQFGRLAVPVWPRGAYELQCDFTASRQKMAFSVVLPTHQSRVTAALLRKDKPIGLSKVRGDFPEGSLNPTRTTKGHVTPDRRHALLIRVIPAGPHSEISVFLDDQPLYSWKGDESDLSMWSRWETPHQRMLALGCGSGSLTCHTLRLKMLSGEAWILAPRPAAGN